MTEPSMTGPSSDGATAPVVVGRQGIYDRDRSVVGYELSLATVEADESGNPGRTIAGALSVGMGRLVGDKRLFLQGDRSLLLDLAPLTLLPAQTVIALGADLGDDEAVVRGCHRLAQQGYTFAIDGLAWLGGTARALPASIVHVDLRSVGLADLTAVHDEFRGRDLALLVTHVDSPAQVDAALAAGVELMQGYAVGTMSYERGAAAAVLNPARLRTAARVLGERLDFDEIEDVLRTEPGLTYQVLQMASLGRMGETRRRVDSVRKALVLAGSWRVQSWIAFLLTSQDAPGGGDEAVTALAQARASELLAVAAGQDASLAFTAGMISAFEQLLHIPAEELAESLPLSDELREAAFGTLTPLGRVVHDVADRIACVGEDVRCGLPVRAVDTALAAGIDWALDACTVLD